MKKGFSTPKKSSSSPKHHEKQPEPEPVQIIENEADIHPEEEEKEKPKPKVIFNDFLFLEVDDDKEEEEIKKELRLEISVDRDQNKLVQKIYMSLYDNEDIFFCMRSHYEPEDFSKLKEKRYIIPFEGVAKEVIFMLKSIKRMEQDYSVRFEIKGDHGFLRFYQNTPLFTKELISFDFESISEEEADEQAQTSYLKISARLELAKNKLKVYNETLKKKNPDIYNDILVNGQDLVHKHEDKKRSLEQFLESNQKVSAGIAQMQQLNQIMHTPNK